MIKWLTVTTVVVVETVKFCWLLTSNHPCSHWSYHLLTFVGDISCKIVVVELVQAPHSASIVSGWSALPDNAVQVCGGIPRVCLQNPVINAETLTFVGSYTLEFEHKTLTFSFLLCAYTEKKIINTPPIIPRTEPSWPTPTTAKTPIFLA